MYTQDEAVAGARSARLGDGAAKLAAVVAVLTLLLTVSCGEHVLTLDATFDRLLPSEPRPSGVVVDRILLHSASAILECVPPDGQGGEQKDPVDPSVIVDLFSRYEVSSHYLIARDGIVYRLVEESLRARHAGKGQLPCGDPYENDLNDNSIGIELAAIGSEDDLRVFFDTAAAQCARPMAYSSWMDRVQESYPDARGFTERQYASLRTLLADIVHRYDAIDFDRRHIFAHSEYAPSRRTDPGELFNWAAVGLSSIACTSRGRSPSDD